MLHNLGRATLVGERTAGASHMVDFVDLPDGFVLGVSITRVADPATGLEWEGVGVACPGVSRDRDRPPDLEHAGDDRVVARRS